MVRDWSTSSFRKARVDLGLSGYREGKLDLASVFVQIKSEAEVSSRRLPLETSRGIDGSNPSDPLRQMYRVRRGPSTGVYPSP